MNFVPKRKTKVILLQLGSPKSPSPKDVGVFLKNFLSDRRVIDINPWIWKVILYFFILPFRSFSSSKLYRRIWTGDSFPLIKITKEFTQKLAGTFYGKNTLEIECAFLLSSPTIKDILDSWQQDQSPAGRIILVPMFPQYSESTIGSGVDAFFGELKKRVQIPDFSVVTNFHRTKAFIDNSVRAIDSHLKKVGNIDRLIISFHGIPKRRVVEKGDVYYRHCLETFLLIAQRVTQLPRDSIEIGFQSRFGSEEWLKPYVNERVDELVSQGHSNIAVYAASFVVDCLETIDELAHELKNQVKMQGGVLYHIPCLNVDDQWVRDFSYYVGTMVEKTYDDIEEISYKIDLEKVKQCSLY